MTSTAFSRCESCGGLGFHRAGDFADRTFPRCKACEGVGQIYLEPVTKRLTAPLTPPKAA
jgi:hypothetical protein